MNLKHKARVALSSHLWNVEHAIESLYNWSNRRPWNGRFNTAQQIVSSQARPSNLFKRSRLFIYSSLFFKYLRNYNSIFLLLKQSQSFQLKINTTSLRLFGSIYINIGIFPLFFQAFTPLSSGICVSQVWCILTYTEGQIQFKVTT